MDMVYIMEVVGCNGIDGTLWDKLPASGIL